jgi:putative hydrolases of HD superfamily
MIDALLEAFALKDEPRTGWRLRGIRNPESVADHSWGTAYLVLLYAGEACANRCRALEIAIVHDLAEALTGDVATRVVEMNDARVASEKREREREAMDRLLADYPPSERQRVFGAWREYEERTTTEARFVRDMNLIDMCLQALRYERGGRYDGDAPNPHFSDYKGLDEFFATSKPRLCTTTGRHLFEEVFARYSEEVSDEQS